MIQQPLLHQVARKGKQGNIKTKHSDVVVKQSKLSLNEKLILIDDLKAGKKVATISKRKQINEATIRTI